MRQGKQAPCSSHSNAALCTLSEGFKAPCKLCVILQALIKLCGLCMCRQDLSKLCVSSVRALGQASRSELACTLQAALHTLSVSMRHPVEAACLGMPLRPCKHPALSAQHPTKAACLEQPQPVAGSPPRCPWPVLMASACGPRSSPFKEEACSPITEAAAAAEARSSGEM